MLDNGLYPKRIQECKRALLKQLFQTRKKGVGLKLNLKWKELCLIY
jgi:hypothetical protein